MFLTFVRTFIGSGVRKLVRTAAFSKNASSCWSMASAQRLYVLSVTVNYTACRVTRTFYCEKCIRHCFHYVSTQTHQMRPRGGCGGPVQLWGAETRVWARPQWALAAGGGAASGVRLRQDPV